MSDTSYTNTERASLLADCDSYDSTEGKNNKYTEAKMEATVRIEKIT